MAAPEDIALPVERARGIKGATLMVSPIPQRAPRLGTAAVVRWRRLARLAVLLSAGLFSVGCARAAPGPEDCVAFAESWLRARPAANPLEADTAFAELVTRCLTEPYDRELVACVVAGRNHDRCRGDYMRRAEARREARFR